MVAHGAFEAVARAEALGCLLVCRGDLEQRVAAGLVHTPLQESVLALGTQRVVVGKPAGSVREKHRLRFVALREGRPADFCEQSLVADPRCGNASDEAGRAALESLQVVALLGRPYSTAGRITPR